jgi:hypothetical protein
MFSIDSEEVMPKKKPAAQLQREIDETLSRAAHATVVKTPGVLKRALEAKFPGFNELLQGWVKYARQGGMKNATFYIEDEGYANWGSSLSPDDVKLIQMIVKTEAGITTPASR